MNLFVDFDFTNLQSETSWFIIIYTAVLIAMFLDLFTGVRKAKQLKIARTSRGFRRTAEKAMLYLLPMLCLTLIDVIVSFKLNYPFFTAAMAIFNIYIEIRSIRENLYSKKELEERGECGKDFLKFLLDHREELEKIFTH